MGLLFEELDSQSSPLGEISLRRRVIPAVSDEPIYEVKLGEEFLMSSLFVDAEIALARLGLAAVEGDGLRVVVGGLGLGYTARAVLDSDRVGQLLVVEALQPVIDWHQRELAPLGRDLNADPRNRYVQGDFFQLATEDGLGFDPTHPCQCYDAILLDIDHSPNALLNDASASFYTPEKLRAMARQLRPGGVFAMWSNEPPDEAFGAVLGGVFSEVEAHRVTFYNRFQNAEAVNTVYVAKTPNV